MKVAVSGINGFVGTHLARDLVTHGHDVIGLAKGPVAGEVADLVTSYTDQDLAQGWPSDDADAVIHLAGLSAVGPSFEDPQRYLTGNSAPVTHLCERLLAEGRSPRVVVISTGAVYAPGTSVSESSPTQTSSPYAVSKLLVELQCAYYRQRGLDIVVMRPFNHIGPGQQRGFLLPDLLAGITGGDLVVGNLDTRRDYTDVRDVARAYRLAIEADRVDAPVLNVCSSVSVSGQAMLDMIVAELGRSVPPMTVDQGRFRPGDPHEIRGDNSLIEQVLGWRPQIDLGSTVRDAVANH